MHTLIPIMSGDQLNELLKEAVEWKGNINGHEAKDCFQARFHQRWHYFQIVESLETIGNNEIDDADEDFKEFDDDP